MDKEKKIENFYLYGKVEKKIISFAGIATKLAYDDATQEVIAFDAQGERLFCQKVNQLQYDVEPPTDE